MQIKAIPGPNLLCCNYPTRLGYRWPTIAATARAGHFLITERSVMEEFAKYPTTSLLPVGDPTAAMANPKFNIDWMAFSAVLFDLDGVVTDTARLHADAWKQLFDPFLRRRAEATDVPFEAFDIAQEYTRYVDGKPRLDGIHSFFSARGICIPQGSPDDPPDAPTVMGLAQRKNTLFLELVQKRGVTAYPGALRLIAALRSMSRSLAVVSSSRNCSTILAAAKLSNSFDVQVDATTAQKLKLRGKPAPDLFLEAARRLAVAPSDAAVIEDAEAGVEAAKSGQFGLIIALDRLGKPDHLRSAGADYVVSDLDQISPVTGPELLPALPSALDNFSLVTERLSGKRTIVFLDYDGTLTPIVARPELAILDCAMRETLRRLADLCPVVVISGRDRSDVARLIGIETITYAGAHGLDIAGRGVSHLEITRGDELTSSVRRAVEFLNAHLSSVDGVLIEDKTYTVAVHYRLVNPDKIEVVERAVADVLKTEPLLRRMSGKKVFELRPTVAWDKGKAVLWLLDKLGLTGPSTIPIYLGDDVTDYDALQAVNHIGIGVLVGTSMQPTCARYHLNNPEDVGIFLKLLCQFLEKGDA
ncbi:MAG: trehalose-phosphatase [Hyphomicrobiaceae bacterium]